MQTPSYARTWLCASLLLFASACDFNTKASAERSAKPAPAAKAADEPRPTPKDSTASDPPTAKTSDAETFGRLVADALRTGSQDALLLEVPGLDPELAAEISKARELFERDFPDLLEAIDDAGVDRSTIEFVRVDDVDDEDWSPLASASVYFRSGDALYFVTTTWMKSEGKVASLGMSSWFKPAQDAD